MKIWVIQQFSDRRVMIRVHGTFVKISWWVKETMIMTMMVVVMMMMKGTGTRKQKIWESL